jgi:hypothetical protein
MLIRFRVQEAQLDVKMVEFTGSLGYGHSWISRVRS